MKRIATTIRCVPRFGYAGTEVRVVDLEVPDDLDDEALLDALRFWFALRGLPEAVYDIDVDDNGHFAIINDDAYSQNWGTPLL
jgi:hypothetical protein